VLGPGLSTDLGERRLRRVGSGLLVVFLHDNVAQLGYLPWQLDLQNLRFTAFVCSLGLITARRFFTNQRELVIVEHEMNTAREIQSAILPERPPASSGLVVAVRYAPMRTVAGDFYDFVAVDDRGLGMLVADVSISRDPRFLPDVPGGEAARDALLGVLFAGVAGTIPDGIALVPVYDVIDQTGIDLQVTSGGWLWKLEAINRSGQGDRYAALTGGVEYTFANMAATGIDLGILTEYAFDERDERALTPLEDDIFVGARLAFNDVSNTQVLGGAAIDRESGASFLNVEASRRVGDRWTVDVEFRGFVNVPPDDLFLYGIRQDDYLQASWTWHW